MFSPLLGDNSPRDWNQSWSVSKVDDAQWSKLRDDVAREYGAFYDAVEKANGDDSLLIATVALAHLAYHLGAIRSRL